MGPGFAWTVAVRFLREGRIQSLLIIVGVAAGVGVVTYISALIEGLQGNTLRRTLGTQPHVVVKPFEEIPRPSLRAGTDTLARQVQPRAQRTRSIDNWQALMAEMRATPNIVAVTPVASGAALAIRGEASRSVALIGIELEGYDRIVALKEKIVEGAARVTPGEALIGVQLAQDLGVGVGERVVIRTGGTSDAADTFKVAGIFDLGSRDLNRRYVYIPLKSAQPLLGIPGGATNLYAAVADMFEADVTAARLKARTGAEVESWMDTNAQLLSALNAQTISTRLIRLFTAVVVMLGIASVLVVSVVQKRKEIGILRAMGATRAQMTQVFLTQGAIVGLVGSVLGVLLAAAMLWVFTNFARGQDGLPLFVVGLPLDLAVTVACVATLCGILAAAAPARRAAQLDPAEAIRL
ncbi:MAG: ABC transporter permease [Betaproteobacteria bacterium]|nr:ABC transporter permease [Betaproteobacteria bacterium]